MSRIIYFATVLTITISSAFLGIQALHVAAEDNLSVGRQATDVLGKKDLLKKTCDIINHGPLSLVVVSAKYPKYSQAFETEDKSIIN